jgi:competence protein ComFC
MGQLCDSSKVSSIISLMSLILDLLFPKYCVGCKKIGSYLCPNCERKLELITVQNCPVCGRKSLTGTTHKFCKNKYSLDGSTSIFNYKFPIKEAIHQIKYRLCKDEIKTFVDLMINYLPKQFPKFEYIVPIPLHSKKLKERGFNQSEEIAKILSQNLSIPLAVNNLIRTKYTAPQFNLKSQERLNNIKNAFTVKNPEKIFHNKILLIDDVATTFSTLNEAASVLKKSGASFVWSLTLAHGK